MIVSPHLDDAVLSCGQLMAGRPDCVVVTVFAGAPLNVQTTPYDEACGFRDSDEALTLRRDEDAEACARLGATPIHLDFPDGQYEPKQELLFVITDKLLRTWEALGRPPVLGPAGLVHPDHEQVAAACIRAFGWQARCPELYVYEELPARVLWPESVEPALTRWEVGTVHHYAPGFLGTGSKVRKAAAIRAYRSQMPQIAPLGDGAGRTCLFVPERYWRPS